MRPLFTTLSQNATFALYSALGLVFLLLGFFYFTQFRAPRNFPPSIVITIESGKGLTEIAQELKDKHIIQSPFWFNNFVISLKLERKIVSGDYYFDRPLNVYQVAKRITSGEFSIEQIKTTIPEGSSVFDISDIILKNYPEFDSSQFILLAKKKEGYLFPDTYKFGSTVTPQNVIDVMTANFNKKIKDENIQTAFADYGKPVNEIITMASLLEGEARQMRTRQIIAGILWERIRRGMPLQVDATFRYVNGKTSKNLTIDDLKIDSPYNTYLYKGLPPTPISNPGLDSILAAATPIATKYLYFLTDSEGKMHYAETFEEHQINVEKYLR
jgi:UPF0755 protein